MHECECHVVYDAERVLRQRIDGIQLRKWSVIAAATAGTAQKEKAVFEHSSAQMI